MRSAPDRNASEIIVLRTNSFDCQSGGSGGRFGTGDGNFTTRGVGQSEGLSDMTWSELTTELLSTASENTNTAESQTSQSRELVFVDESVANLEQMIADLHLESTSDPNRDFETVILNSRTDGTMQVSSALMQFTSCLTGRRKARDWVRQ